MDIVVSASPLLGPVNAPPAAAPVLTALVCAALADRPTTLALSSLGDDARTVAQGLHALGAGFAAEPGALTVTPAARERLPKTVRLYCGESDAALRTLLPVTAALGLETEFHAGPRLRRHPHGQLLRPLREHGYVLTENRFPLHFNGRLNPGNSPDEYRLSDADAGIVNGLLPALTLVGGSLLTDTPPAETEPVAQILRAFGVPVTREQNGFSVTPAALVSPGRLTVESDWQAAVCWLCCGLRVRGLNPDSPQPERAVCEYLSQMGGRISAEAGGVRADLSALHGGEHLDLCHAPGLLPALAVLAATRSGLTLFTDSSRPVRQHGGLPEATVELLTALGGDAVLDDNELRVRGRAHLKGGNAECRNDPRLVAAALLAAQSCTDAVRICGTEAATEPYPAFLDDYIRMGGSAEPI